MTTFVLITGGRDYANVGHMHGVLTQLYAHFGDDLCLVQGGARGADRIAKQWAAGVGVKSITVDAAWEALGKRAGILRNGWMLELLPIKFVLAFPGGTGTRDMCVRAAAAGVPVYQA